MPLTEDCCRKILAQLRNLVEHVSLKVQSNGQDIEITYDNLEKANAYVISPMALVLVGQSELWDKLQLHAYAAIRQRIDIQRKLPHLDRSQVGGYVKSLGKFPFHFLA
jgi:hypothetical protein